MNAITKTEFWATGYIASHRPLTAREFWQEAWQSVRQGRYYYEQPLVPVALRCLSDRSPWSETSRHERWLTRSVGEYAIARRLPVSQAARSLIPARCRVYGSWALRRTFQ